MEADSTAGALNNSLAMLAVIGMRETGAKGFAYFRRSETGDLIRSVDSGVFIHEDELSGNGCVATFPLRLNGVVNGFLAFTFEDKISCEGARSQLKPLARTIDKLWAAQAMKQVYLDVLESIVSLQTEIIDSKIASRARGVVGNPSSGGGIDEIIRHVESVLRQNPISRLLGQLLADLQSEVEERDWAEKAKAILQKDHHMSEEEAHSYLRKSSRQSRKRFVEVARQIVEGREGMPA